MIAHFQLYFVDLVSCVTTGACNVQHVVTVGLVHWLCNLSLLCASSPAKIYVTIGLVHWRCDIDGERIGLGQSELNRVNCSTDRPEATLLINLLRRDNGSTPAPALPFR